MLPRSTKIFFVSLGKVQCFILIINDFLQLIYLSFATINADGRYLP